MHEQPSNQPEVIAVGRAPATASPVPGCVGRMGACCGHGVLRGRGPWGASLFDFWASGVLREGPPADPVWRAA
jgi:hypothetical protein